MNDKLNWKEKRSLIVQSGLQLIPNVGGALSTAYYGTKQEKRFKRIESFYQELSEEVGKIQLQLPSIDIHNQDSLIALIEELNEKIEREHTEQKRDYFKRYLLSTLSSPTNDNFDERRFFLDALGNMTLLECEILLLLYRNNEIRFQIRTIGIPGVKQFAIVGAINRLKTYGFIQSYTDGIYFGREDNTMQEYVIPSDFGINFIQYCLM
ncbi:hypothetical protein ACQKFU_28920 [Bacillus mycoides]|uniref:hypothetical protein n=1 Tax=Bacillus mycoides TaxID=1405 RepID=UPI003D075635